MGVATKICGTGLTIDMVEKAVNKHYKTNNVIDAFDAIEIGEGKGFVSVMVRMKITWAHTNIELPSSFIIKVPSTIQATRISEKVESNEKEFADSMAETLDKNVQQLHKIECTFYENIAALPSFPVTTVPCYGIMPITATHPGFVIMQDLYGIVGHEQLMVSGLTLAQCLDVGQFGRCLHFSF